MTDKAFCSGFDRHTQPMQSEAGKMSCITGIVY